MVKPFSVSQVRYAQRLCKSLALVNFPKFNSTSATSYIACQFRDILSRMIF